VSTESAKANKKPKNESGVKKLSKEVTSAKLASKDDDTSKDLSAKLAKLISKEDHSDTVKKNRGKELSMEKQLEQVKCAHKPDVHQKVVYRYRSERHFRHFKSEERLSVHFCSNPKVSNSIVG
jgi:hypothetical protein